MQVKKRQLELDMEQQTGSKSGKEYVMSPCSFNLHAEYIMRNAGHKHSEAQAGIKIAGRNIKTSNIQITSPLWQKAKMN